MASSFKLVKDVVTNEAGLLSGHSCWSLNSVFGFIDVNIAAYSRHSGFFMRHELGN